MSGKKVKKYMKVKTQSSTDNALTLLLVLLIFVMIFVFITGHSHTQLDLIKENSKLFIKNEIGAFDVRPSYQASSLIVMFFFRELFETIRPYSKRILLSLKTTSKT
jgi:hypothetical protein